MGGVNQIGKEIVMFHFSLRWFQHVMSKEQCPIYTFVIYSQSSQIF